jgi:hemoglobin/transferrin/lactoferrin receptor protein
MLELISSTSYLEIIIRSIKTNEYMKNIVFLCGWVLCFYSNNAQTVQIIDKETKEPIGGAMVVCEKLDIRLLSDAKGEMDIAKLAGCEEIKVIGFGYKTVVLSVTQLQIDGFIIPLEASPLQIGEMVISATRWAQTSRDIPNHITVISKRDAALHNPQTAADLLGSSGEVFIQKSQQGGGSPMIRGFSTNRLLYAVDGVRMNSAIFRSGNLQNVISLDAFAIESTEVFFGPGSVIYGSDAIGGVMSFRTLTPQFSSSKDPFITGKVVNRYSSANGEQTMHFDVNVGWKKWATVTSLTHSRFGDLRMGTKGPEEYLKTFYVQRIDSVDRIMDNPDPLVQNPTGYSQMNMMQKIRFSPNNKWDFQYAFHYSETSSYSRYDRLIELRPDGLPRSAVWKYGPQKWMMNNLTIAYTHKNILFDRMTIRLAQQYFEESRIDRNFSGNQRFRLRTQLEKVDAYSATIDFEKKNGKSTIFYGGEYVLNLVDSRGTAIDIRNGSNLLVSDRYPASTWASYAGFINYQYAFSDQLLLQTGGRYSVFDIQSDFSRHLSFFPFDFVSSSIHNSAITGNIGLIYRPDETWKLSVNGSTGFRAPNVDDIGKIFDFAGGEVVVPNTSLKAEYAYNGEINVSKVFGDFIKIDVAAFYTYLDNAMVRRAFQVNGQDSILYDGEMSRVYAIQNAAYANVYGVNAGVEIKLPQGFSLLSRYNYQLGVEEMDNGALSRARHAAPAFGVTRLTLQKSKLTMQLYATYSAGVSFDDLNEEEKQKPFIYAKDENGNPYSPAWYTLNYKAMYQFHKNFSVSAGIENLTDQRYRPYSSGLVAPGRNLVLSIKAVF